MQRAGGNVGIGTTSPSQTLHVAGNARITGALYDSSNSAGTSGQVLTSTGTGISWSSSGASVTGSGTTNYIAKFTGSTNLGSSVIYDDGTSIGIGTTPTSQANYRFLQVSGSNAAVIETMVGSTRIGGFDSDAANLYVGSVGSYPVVFRTAVTERMRLTAAGNLGIGTSSPSYPLHVYSSGQSSIAVETSGRKWGILTNTSWANNGFSIYDLTGDVSRVNVDTSGNVGIGTTSPSQKLDVQGPVAIGPDTVYSYSTITTTATTANQVVTAVSSSTYRTAKFIIQATDATGGKYQSQEILAVHNGSSVAHTEYTAINVGGAVATYDVDISGGTLRLLCTPLSANSTVFKVQIVLVKV